MENIYPCTENVHDKIGKPICTVGTHMAERPHHEEAVEVLQELGLKEYEAKSFVALTQLGTGTAKQVSEISEVPRTRVYDAVRVLEAKGLVEVHHSSPQQFRAVSIEEAAGTLKQEYVNRTDSLRDSLQDIAQTSPDGRGEETTHEVWALTGDTAISNRTQQLIETADSEVLMVLGTGSILNDDLLDSMADAHARGVSVIIGTIDEGVKDRIKEHIPDVEVYVSGLEWLTSAVLPGDETEISRLLLVDQNTILVSTFHKQSSDGRSHEQAVFGRGFENGLVVIMRRLMATGLLPVNDPGKDDG